MGILAKRFIELLYSDIREWEILARYFETLKTDLSYQEFGTPSGKVKAEQLRDRIRELRAFIEQLEKAKYGTPTTMVVGERIRYLREAKALSQFDIERGSGLLRCYISRVENGHTVPSVATLEKISKGHGNPHVPAILCGGYTPPSARTFRGREIFPKNPGAAQTSKSVNSVSGAHFSAG